MRGAVANAGIGIMCKAVEMSLADWRRQTAVNLDGVFLSVKYAVPAMRRSGRGSIIITSSVAGLTDRAMPTCEPRDLVGPAQPGGKCGLRPNPLQPVISSALHAQNASV
jgi:NAD(P)-dependent dehydrogenase (short-subunit alcohol dehydrogenase family)